MKKSLKCSETAFLSEIMDPLLSLNVDWNIGVLFLLIIFLIIPHDFFIHDEDELILPWYYRVSMFLGTI